MNMIAVFYLAPVAIPLKFGAYALLFALSVYYLISPGRTKGLSRKPKRMVNAYEILLTATICTGAEIVLYGFVLLGKVKLPLWFGVANAIVAIFVLLALCLAGLIRIYTASSNFGVVKRVLFVVLWWLPGFDFVMLLHVCMIARFEARLAIKRFRRDEMRKETAVCKTRYPILLVHGIFFRDWEKFNYWGRIPEALIANGATIFYGMQQSSESVEISAEELKRRIMQVIEETGCEKVNIIAHSKGGLDARYAISRLGMDAYVASLTTVNTPHRGCKFAGRALRMLPDKPVAVVGDQYNKLFMRLGDKAPDFTAGINELTTEKCAELNEIMTDRPGVLYQSVGSAMSAPGSATMPLSLVYRIIKLVEGENDGLVSTTSMKWGDYRGTIKVKGKKGVSHADVIDLFRYDIKGFDVLEYYVQLVRELKEKGL
jgi:triacylglycerol lipase